MRFALIGSVLLIGACQMTAPPDATERQTASHKTSAAIFHAGSAKQFAEVVARVEPVGEAECRRRTNGVKCDFLIRVDPRKSARPNAFQGEDKSGRPVITFTQKLLAETPNPHELAFVLSHEMAHHISGHLRRQRANSKSEAAVFADLAELTGGSASEVANAQLIGSVVGALRFSKEFELEADKLGTVITHKSGYNPLIGMEFFNRIPDPGDRFLGTHPPNAERIRVVRRASRSLGVTE